MSLYDILGVDKGATKEELKKAYRKKAKESHPDNGGDGFADIGKAYAILSNDSKRAQYDATGTVNEKSPDDEARGELMILFNAYIDNHTASYIENANILKEMKGALEVKIYDTEDTIKKSDREICKYNKIKGRLKRKKGGNNLFQALIEKKMIDIDQHIVAMKKDIDKFKRVLDMLCDYKDVKKFDDDYRIAIDLRSFFGS